MQTIEVFELIDDVASARKFQLLLGQQLGELSVIDEKSKIVLQFLSVGRQHYDTIVLLIEQDRNPSSASALLRPLSDVMHRGTWVATCATPKQIAEIAAKKFDYSKVNTAQQVADTYGGTGLSKEQREVLHGFTHGGYEQLERQVSSKGLIEPEFDLPFLRKTVRGSSIAVAVLAVQACTTVDRVDIANAIWKAWLQLFEE
jgi:hypothetical protein